MERDDLNKYQLFLNYLYYLKQMSHSHDLTLSHCKAYLEASEYSAQMERIEKSIHPQAHHPKEIMLLRINHCLSQQALATVLYLISQIVRYYFNEGLFFFNNKQDITAKTVFYQAKQIMNYIKNYICAMDARKSSKTSANRASST